MLHFWECVNAIVCCSRTREDLRAANQRINTMLADYGDVVPRRELEMIEASCKVCVCVCVCVLCVYVRVCVCVAHIPAFCLDSCGVTLYNLELGDRGGGCEERTHSPDGGAQVRVPFTLLPRALT